MGTGGHIQHLWENRSLTFGDVKEILRQASAGELKEVQEKIDGFPAMMTWNESLGEIRFARNTSDMKNGGMDGDAIAQRFSRGYAMDEALTNAYGILSRGVTAIPSEDRIAAFGETGNAWYPIELLYPKDPNMINYDRNNIVFLDKGARVFDGEGNRIETPAEMKKRFGIIARNIDAMQEATAQKEWKIRGPGVVALRRLSSDGPLKRASSRIDRIASQFGLGDGDTMEDYFIEGIKDMMDYDGVDVPRSSRDDLARRMLGDKSAPTVPQLTKGLDPKRRTEVRDFARRRGEMLKTLTRPIEQVIIDFTVELMKGVESVFMVDPGSSAREVNRVRGEVRSAIDAIESSDADEAIAVVHDEMSKLRRIENIVSPVEGIVFKYKGDTLKLTGTFSPARSIMTLFHYGGKGFTKGSGAMNTGDDLANESLLRAWIGGLISD